jgi:hypothetical protein
VEKKKSMAIGNACVLFWFWSLVSAADSAPSVPVPRLAAQIPYVVEGWIDVEPHPAISSPMVERWKADLMASAQRLLGEAWDLALVDAPVSVRRQLPDAPKARREGTVDKIFVARLRWIDRSSSIELVSDEYDLSTRTWGGSNQQVVSSDRRVGDAILESWLESFRPLAEIVGRSRGRGEISLKGEALISKASGIRFGRSGQVFSIYRQLADGSDPPAAVAWSYLILKPASTDSTKLVESTEIASLFRDPLTKRSRQKIKLWGMGIAQADRGETQVTFRTRPGDRPIVGYEVAIKPWGDPATYSIGTTNYRGEIDIRFPDGVARGESSVCEVLLLSGSTVVARFPLVPGSPKELLAQASIDPLLAEISGTMMAMQEEIVDQSARRKILELRLKKAASENLLDKTKEIAQSINEIPRRTSFQQRLDKVKEQVAVRSKELKQNRIGSNVNRLFLQTERLIQAVPQDEVVIETTTETVPNP